MTHCTLSEQVDGWTDLQEQLDARGLYFSRFFTIIFISLASFIFLNMFVAVMIFHTEVRTYVQGLGLGFRLARGAVDLVCRPSLDHTWSSPCTCG